MAELSSFLSLIVVLPHQKPALLSLLLTYLPFPVYPVNWKDHPDSTHYHKGLTVFIQDEQFSSLITTSARLLVSGARMRKQVGQEVIKTTVEVVHNPLVIKLNWLRPLHIVDITF